jgi:mannosyltransferase
MKRYQLFFVVVVLIIAFQLRVWGLFDRNIWWDEGYSIWIARLPVPELIETTAFDVHPPLYYIILKGWTAVAGSELFAQRFLSVLIGLVGVAFAFQLGKSLRGFWTGLLTCLFVAISLITIRWSQEMRMHILAPTLANFTLWAAIRLWRKPSLRRASIYAVLVAAGLYTLYLWVAVPVITNAAVGVEWLLSGHKWRKLRWWLAAQIGAVVSYLPWIIYGLPKVRRAETSEPFSILFGLKLYIVSTVVGIQENIENYQWYALAVWAIMLLGIVFIWRDDKQHNRRFELGLLVSGVIVIGAFVFAIAVPLHPDLGRPLDPRYFLTLSITIYALLAWSVIALSQSRRWVAVVLTLLIVGVSAIGLRSFYPDRYQRDQYWSISAMLEARRQPEDGVILHTGRGWPVFAAHYSSEWVGTPFNINIDPGYANFVLEPVWNDSEAVWLVVDRDHLVDDPHENVIAWLTERAVYEESWDFDDRELYFFARTQERAGDVHAVAPDATIPEEPSISFNSGAKLMASDIALNAYPIGGWVYWSLFWETPPTSTFEINMDGESQRRFVKEAPSRVSKNSVTHQQVSFRLDPELTPGTYELSLVIDGETSGTVETVMVLDSTVNGIVVDPDISHELYYGFGDHITLLGYDISQTRGAPGDEITVTLYWTTSELLDKRYKVSVALLGQSFNPANNTPLWGQHDSEPVNWQAPTTRWFPGEIISDEHRIDIDRNAPEADYDIVVVIYGLTDNTRLPITDANNREIGDMVPLTGFEVED